MGKKVVCVTGASGYIGSWLVKFLLQRGYTVKATVRNLFNATVCSLDVDVLVADDTDKVAHLKALEGANGRLHLFEANLVDEGSFDSAIDGCEGVFHVASPVLLETTDPQGTLNVLNSCKRVPSVKRVVITSSTSAIIFARNPPRPDFVDETWFSDLTLSEEKKEWYAFAKTMEEQAAWKFAKENCVDVVMLHPGYVIGPLLQPTLSFSSKSFIDLIKEGKELLPGGVYRYVDVRDVAEAHILAFENPSANGRYCLVGKVANSFQAMEILKEIYPSINLHSTITEIDQQTRHAKFPKKRLKV